MNAKRWMSTLALAALLVEQALPVHVVSMPCNMVGHSRIEICDHCDGDPRALPESCLSLAACCRIGPDAVPEITPIILANRPGAPEDPTIGGPPPVAPRLGPVACFLLDNAHSGVSPPHLEPPTRTTVLRI